jgi:hypothetical protein
VINAIAVWNTRYEGNHSKPGELDSQHPVLNGLHPRLRPPHRRELPIARSQLNEPAFAAAWAEGRNMTLEQLTFPHESLSRSSVPNALKF